MPAFECPVSAGAAEMALQANNVIPVGALGLGDRGIYGLVLLYTPQEEGTGWSCGGGRINSATWGGTIWW